MAGFLGFGNFTKPGKGVKKEEHKKRSFFAFFDLLFRKFGKLIQLNVLYILFCIPIVTIGPATAALMKIVRYYNEGKPVFLFSDFFDAFKENFFQGFIMSLITGAIVVAGYVSITYYFIKCAESMWYFIPLAILTLIAVVLVFASFYTFLLISTVHLKMFAVLKNSVMLAILGLKSNIFTLVFAGGLLGVSAYFFPVTILIILPFTFSISALIICFNSFKNVYKYIIRPYYVTNELPDPYDPAEFEKEEPIFEDTL